MKNFNDLEFETHPGDPNGIMACMTFDNGYGCSVICSIISYGHEDGLYEMAVIGPDDKISYDTGITTDVLGYLTEQDVSKYMKQIQQLGDNKMNKIIFKQDQLQKATDFVIYAQKHQVEVSMLQSSEDTYYVFISTTELGRLTSYYSADDKTEELKHIVDNLLREVK